MQPPDPCFNRDTPKIEIVKWWALAILAVSAIPFIYLTKPFWWVWDKYFRLNPYPIKPEDCHPTYQKAEVFFKEEQAKIQYRGAMELGPFKAGEKELLVLNGLLPDHQLKPKDKATVQITRLYYVRFTGARLEIKVVSCSLVVPVTEGVSQIRFTGGKPPVRCYWEPEHHWLRVSSPVHEGWTLGAYDLEAFTHKRGNKD